MKLKTVVTASLLLFAATSVVYLVISESSARVEGPVDDRTGALHVATPASSEYSNAEGQAQRKVVAYYFHGTIRCTTCRAIEAYAHEAVETGFPEELQSGTLEWYAINIEEPVNQHFIDEYELTTRSLVLVEMEDGSRTRWANLERVWDLVGDPDAFIRYVQSETATFLRDS